MRPSPQMQLSLGSHGEVDRIVSRDQYYVKTKVSRLTPSSLGMDRREFKRLLGLANRALRDSRGGGVMERFEAVSKLLFTKIVDEREVAGTWPGGAAKDISELAWGAGDNDRIVYERARSVWQRAIAAHPTVFNGDRARFPADVHGVARIVAILDQVNLSETSLDVKGPAYEELLRNTFEKNENQQYFTPRHVVDFMVEICDPGPDDAICDPAVGSGGFLVSALEWVQQQQPEPAGFISRMRGTDIDERMAWVARINMLMHGGDPRSILHLPGAGALAPLMRIQRILPRASFDLILANPPFGSDMTDREALRQFVTGAGRSSRRRGVLFVERCLQLLRPSGRLAIILDDSVLNLEKNSDLRQLVREQALVEDVISLPDVTFMPYSTAKASILVVQRKPDDAARQGRVFMADVEDVGNRPNGDPLYGDEVDEKGDRKLQTDLPTVLKVHRRVASSGRLPRRSNRPLIFRADLDGEFSDASERLDVFFYHPARARARRQLDGSSHSLMRLGDLFELDGSAVKPSDEQGDNPIRWIGLADIESLTGRFAVSKIPADRIRSNAHRFRAGDVLFSRLRPKLRKTIVIPDRDEGGYCSSELLVLRPPRDSRRRLLPELLAYLLRSELVYGQLIYQITGVGRPRVGAGAVARLVLPVPPIGEQRRFLQQLRNADREFDRRRNEAARQLERAQESMERGFDEVLSALCPPDGQLGGVGSSVGVASLSA